MLARSHDSSNPKEQLSALFCRHAAPCLKGFIGSFDGTIGQLFGGLLKLSHHLGAVRGIDTLQLVFGGDALAANYQRILVTEFTFNFLESGAHRLRVFFPGEISQRFVTEFSWHLSLHRRVDCFSV